MNLIKNLKRFLVSKRYGFTFYRTKSFNLPKKIKINGKCKELSLPSNSTYIELFRDVLLDDEYFLKILPKSEIKFIVDVGGNLGIFSITARLFFPRSKIHCYEPNINNLQYLTKNGTSFHFEVFSEAVSLRCGKADLHLADKHDTSASLNYMQNGKINVVNLKEIIKRSSSNYIDLLKLDCEGHEYQILQDYDSLQAVKFITLEYHLDIKCDEDQLQKLKIMLTKANFTIIKEDTRNKCLGIIMAKNDRF
jgi:FkbM family methyltransferase